MVHYLVNLALRSIEPESDERVRAHKIAPIKGFQPPAQCKSWLNSASFCAKPRVVPRKNLRSE